MRNSGLYTNTSNVGAIVGLVVVTVLVAYASTHSTEIVNGTVSLAKQGLRKVESILHKGKKQYAVAYRTVDGTIYDTGKRIWK